MILVRLTPYGFRLRLNATDRTEHGTGAIENTQGTFDLNSKVNVSRRINNIDTVLLVLAFHTSPETGGSSRGNGNTAFLLLLHPVHGGSAVVYLTYLVRYACVIQDTFGCGGLARINVRHDTDIPVTIDRRLASHFPNLF